MSWFRWLLIVLIVLETIIGVATINEPREPRTANHAAWNVLFNGLVIAGIVYFWS